MKELLHTYEQSIERKDQVIANLTNGLHKQKEKLEMAKTFSEWKIRHNDSQREVRTFSSDVNPQSWMVEHISIVGEKKLVSVL